MLIFDLYCTAFEFNTRNVLTAVIWDETKKTESKTHLVGNSIEDLCIKVHKTYPDQFPSLNELEREMILVNNLNVVNGKNSFNTAYPNIV